jgi:hypothetical protein
MGTTTRPALTAQFWRTRRSAAVAGIVAALLLLTAMAMVRLALEGTDPRTLVLDSDRRSLVRVGLNLVPFAGIAFLWFIGVVREQIAAVEDRLFSTVFLGSGLLFLALLFQGAVTTTGLDTLSSASAASSGVVPAFWTFGVGTTHTLVSVYAMRMAAVFTLSVSTLGLRTAAFPRWVALLGYGAALVLMVAAGEHKWAQLVFPCWVLVLSVVILVTRPTGEPHE